LRTRSSLLGDFGASEHPSHVAVVVRLSWCPSPPGNAGKGLIMGSGKCAATLPQNVLLGFSIPAVMLPQDILLGISIPAASFPQDILGCSISAASFPQYILLGSSIPAASFPQDILLGCSIPAASFPQNILGCSIPAPSFPQNILMGISIPAASFHQDILGCTIPAASFPQNILLGCSIPAASFPQDIFPAPMVWGCFGRGERGWARCLLGSAARRVPAGRGNVLFSLGGRTVCPGRFPVILRGAGAGQAVLGAEGSFTLCLTLGTRRLIPQEPLAARPAPAHGTGAAGRKDAFQKARKKPQETQDREVFQPLACREPLGWAAHVCTPMHMRVQQPGTKQGCIWGAFGISLLLGEGVSGMPGWQPLASCFSLRPNPARDGKLGMFAAMLCLLT